MIRFSELSVWFHLFIIIIYITSVFTLSRNPAFTYIQNNDPDMHLEHYNYARLTFLRGHVVGERHLNKKGNCNATCSDYQRTRYYHHPDNSSLKQTIICNGNIYQCAEINHFSTFQTMRIDNQLFEFLHNKETNEYEFRKSDDDLVYFYWRRDHKLVMHDTLYDSSHCQMCKCYCDDIYNKNSIRSFCQDLVSSNIDHGYVITGLRFVVRKQVIHIEIQQGQLIYGQIDRNTVHWKVGHDCVYYGSLSYEHRSIQLDDIVVPPHSVITAVSWNRYDRPTKKLGRTIGRLSLLVRATNIDYYGNLIPNQWTAYHKVDVRRTHFKVNRVDVSTSVPTKGIEISEPNKYYIKFKPTDWTKDFAQNVVPFIDLQEVFTYPPVPLSGIGLYLRAARGFGGFLAFKLILNETINAHHSYKII